jgi:hypothetical protein
MELYPVSTLYPLIERIFRFPLGDGATFSESVHMEVLTGASRSPPESVVHKTKWLSSEDRILLDVIAKHGTENWSFIAQFIHGRTGKQCRERWMNQLAPCLRKESWSSDEDATLFSAHARFGNAWATIAQFLPGRSYNHIKNRWSWIRRHQARMLSLQPMPFAHMAFAPLAVPAAANAKAFDRPVT